MLTLEWLFQRTQADTRAIKAPEPDWGQDLRSETQKLTIFCQQIVKTNADDENESIFSVSRLHGCV